MKNIIDKMTNAAHAGGSILLQHFGTELEVHQKTSASDICTIADLQSERIIIDTLEKHFPDYNIFSEEAGHKDRKSKYTFFIDPLDGTSNFVLGIPHFSISIALLEWSKPVAAVVYNPILKLTYHAERGKGAYLGNNKIKASEETDIERSFISLAAGYTVTNDTMADMIRMLKQKEVKRVITQWSPALDFCLLASGKIEGIVNYSNDVYDFIAGKLIAKEAGAVITTMEGIEELDEQNNQFIIANNSTILEHLLEAMTRVRF